MQRDLSIPSRRLRPLLLLGVAAWLSLATGCAAFLTAKGEVREPKAPAVQIGIGRDPGDLHVDAEHVFWLNDRTDLMMVSKTGGTIRRLAFTEDDLRPSLTILGSDGADVFWLLGTAPSKHSAPNDIVFHTGIASGVAQPVTLPDGWNSASVGWDHTDFFGFRDPMGAYERMPKLGGATTPVFEMQGNTRSGLMFSGDSIYYRREYTAVDSEIFAVPKSGGASKSLARGEIVDFTVGDGVVAWIDHEKRTIHTLVIATGVRSDIKTFGTGIKCLTASGGRIYWGEDFLYSVEVAGSGGGAQVPTFYAGRAIEAAVDDGFVFWLEAEGAVMKRAIR